jgi:CYTH domain-containing protein
MNETQSKLGKILGTIVGTNAMIDTVSKLVQADREKTSAEIAEIQKAIDSVAAILGEMSIAIQNEQENVSGLIRGVDAVLRAQHGIVLIELDYLRRAERRSVVYWIGRGFKRVFKSKGGSNV